MPNTMQATTELRSPPPQSDLSVRWYWVLCLATVAAYLGLWLANFHLFYGWHFDDWAVFHKGSATIRDGREGASR